MNSDQQKILPWFDPGDKRDYFYVTWNMTRKCNYNCSFCPFHDNKQELRSGAELDRIARWIVDAIPADSSRTMVTIFGGEPSLYKELPNIVRNLRAMGIHNVVVYTNLSQEGIRYRALTDMTGVEIMTTWHEQFISAELYLRKLQFIWPDGNPHVEVRVMDCDPNYHELINTAKRCGFRTSVGSLHHNRDKQRKPEPTGGIVDSGKWKNMIDKDDHGFTGWTCLSGCRAVYIEDNGDVFPCQSIAHAGNQGKMDNSAFFLGNILDRDPIKLGDPMRCPMKRCSLGLPITKYKQEDEHARATVHQF